MRTTHLVAFLATSVMTLVSIGACSGDDSSSNSSGVTSGGSSAGGAAAGGDTSSGGDIFTSATGGQSSSVGGGCASESATADLVKKPVDIIFIIDNSGSMGQEIQGVQDNINVNFATIIENSGVDYRVIMVTQHGPIGPESVCIEAPLSGIPAGGCANPPTQPVDNPPKFFHYSVPIGSHNPVCQLLDGYDQQDEFGNHPLGWSALLRDESYKVFVMITDDGISCSLDGTTYNDANNAANGQIAADAFDAAVLALSPTQFGSAMERNYVMYSLIALQNLDPNDPTLPWLPTDPITTAECPTAADPGTGYQAISVLTGGLRFPLCEPLFYDTVFNEIAAGVIAGAQLACNFSIPTAPSGQTIDLDTVTVNYTPMGMGAPTEYSQVANANACTADSFYIDLAAQEIVLCPEACNVVQADEAAQIDIVFQCPGGVN
jgi:hypothetical protein